MALPDYMNAPTKTSEVLNNALIAFDVPLELVLPESLPTLGCVGHPATPMPVPKTTMYKDHSAVLRQNDVRFSRQVSTTQREPKSHRVQTGSHTSLRQSIP